MTLVYFLQYSMKLVEKIKKGDLRRQSNVSLAKEVSFVKVKEEGAKVKDQGAKEVSKVKDEDK